MRFSFRPFRKLQWQLSLSYTLVAAGALLVVELALITLGLVFINSDVLPGMLLRGFRETFSVNLRPYLDRPEPDLRGLDNYLSAYLTESTSSPRINGVGVDGEGQFSGQIWSASESQDNLVVLDPPGRILWAQHPEQYPATGEMLDPDLIPGLPQVLPAAMANERDPARLYTRVGDLLVMAIPIDSEDGQRVLGMMVLTLEMPTITNPNFLRQLLPTILASVLLFTLAAGLVGSVFGFFTARRLTRRLGSVSTAADAWSRGDFSIFIQDAADDELGELARRLNAMAEHLQNLMGARQTLATIEERNRIARELHDSVKQQVFATSMQIGAARALLPDDDSPAVQRLKEAERLTKQAQSELTAMIRELRPAALEEKGLVRALHEMTDEWSRQTGIQAQFDCSERVKETSLPLAKEQTIFRVAQEALANTSRHSKANSLRMGLSSSGGEIHLTVIDDGCGFNPSAPRKGMGLRSMRERIEAQRGRLEIDSAPGKGTRLSITIPIEEG
ncbi:MAG: sensor histidine kinase [Chloroflexi bacterium]|nr:sensor histidine kinase [Chloroflexota bacterium]